MEIKNDEVNLKNDSDSNSNSHFKREMSSRKEDSFRTLPFFLSTFVLSRISLCLFFLLKIFMEKKKVSYMQSDLSFWIAKSCWKKMCTSCIVLFPKLCDKNETFPLLPFLSYLISKGWGGGFSRLCEIFHFPLACKSVE